MKTTKVDYVPGIGQIVETQRDFYNELLDLDADNAGLITPFQEMKARIRTREGKAIGRYYGTWTTAGFEYARDQLPLLKLKSKLLNPDLAQQAVEANKNNIFQQILLKNMSNL